MKIWLDDDRPAPEGWTWCKTALDAIGLLAGIQTDPKQRHKLTHMSFDHDLADVHYEYFGAIQLPEGHPVRELAMREAAKEMTGYEVLLWIIEHEVWPSEACYVHTHNSVRGPVMADMINRYGPYDTRCRWTPYMPTAEEIKDLLNEA